MSSEVKGYFASAKSFDHLRHKAVFALRDCPQTDQSHLLALFAIFCTSRTRL